MDVTGQVLFTFTKVSRPRYLLLDSDGRVLVADYDSDHVLLLNSELELPRPLIDTDSRVKLWQPSRLCYNEFTSQLYVVHSNRVVSIYNVGFTE